MRYFLVDAFCDRPFGGNPAAVCLCDAPPSEGLMRAVAAEFNLSETAFLLREGSAWRLRWFSPAMEIPLCGHGTLASARALLEAGLARRGETLAFETLSGLLEARLEGDWIELDFPARPALEAEPFPGLLEAMRLPEPPRWVGVNAGRNWLLELGSAEEVARLEPDRAAVMALGDRLHGVIVTASGDARRSGAAAAPATDGPETVLAAITSRFFAPEAGVFEDPVTGSAHCALAPHWAPRLGAGPWPARQASDRGGLLRVELRGGRVGLAGRTALVAEGRLLV